MPLGALRAVLTITPGREELGMLRMRPIHLRIERRSSGSSVRPISYTSRPPSPKLTRSLPLNVPISPPRRLERLHAPPEYSGFEPFHFSPRYEGQEEKMMAEMMAAFHSLGVPTVPVKRLAH